MLVAQGLHKHFDGVTALSEAGITLHRGEVHGLVGENGAGKSTLVNILSGVISPDSGSLTLDGRDVRFANARDAARNGISVVSQEIMTFQDLTVLENLFPLGGPTRFGLVSRRSMAYRARPVLEEMGLDVPLHTRVSELSLAERQLLEICRALLQNPTVLILDEPTSALSQEATAHLFRTTSELAARGLAVLYISHVLEDVLAQAHRVSVLRDGGTVLSGAEIDQVRLDDLVRAMLGSVVTSPDRTTSHWRDRKATGRPTVSLVGVSVPGRLQEVSLCVFASEIVGLTGLDGAGQLEALAVVTGSSRPSEGYVRLKGFPHPGSLRAAIAAGVAVVPGDRQGRGLNLDAPLWENVTSVSWLGLGRYSAMARRSALVNATSRQLVALRIKGGPLDRMAKLSGGNQQKAVFAKWLEATPSVLVLDDPTRGVDVGARAEMHQLIRSLASDGKTVLITSSDLTELVELCHRVVVFSKGRIVGDVSGERLTETELVLAMNAGLTS